MEITVKSPKSNREITIEVNCPSGLDAKLAEWSPEVVDSLAERMFATDIGNKCRVLLNATAEDGTPTNSEEAVMQYAASYVPGVKRTAGPKKVTAKQAEAAIPSMSAEELKKLLEDARAQLAKLEG